MKIFQDMDSVGWGGKVNFVDENNVLLGYDMDSCCCEHFGWFIADQPATEVPAVTEEAGELTDYRFDPDYFSESYNDYFDRGGMVLFRITNGPQEKYLHLYNIHNGYYSHGFTFSKDDQQIREGHL